MVYVLLWLLFGIVSAVAAHNRGRSGCGFGLLGVLLGPFGLILALVVKEKVEASQPPPLQMHQPRIDFRHSAPPQPAERGTPPSQPKRADYADIADELQKLRALRDEGLISDEEFEAAKARLRDRMNPSGMQGD